MTKHEKFHDALFACLMSANHNEREELTWAFKAYKSIRSVAIKQQPMARSLMATIEEVVRAYEFDRSQRLEKGNV